MLDADGAASVPFLILISMSIWLGLLKTNWEIRGGVFDGRMGNNPPLRDEQRYEPTQYLGLLEMTDLQERER